MIRECKKLLPYILNLIIITVRDILRAQNLSLSADFSIKLLIKKRILQCIQVYLISVVCALHFFLIFFTQGDFMSIIPDI